jgi:uncharacterized protein
LPARRVWLQPPTDEEPALRYAEPDDIPRRSSLSGECSMDVIATLLMLLPFLLILLLANLAEQRKERGNSGLGFAVFSYALLCFLYAVLILLGLVLQLVGLVAAAGLAPSPTANIALRPELLPSLASMGASLWIPSVLGMILLAPPVRRLIARVVPIDPSSTVHAVALSYVMLVVVNLAFTMAMGLGNLADLIEQSNSEGISQASSLTGLWAQALAFVVLALIGVGWLTRRRWRPVLERLAIVRPSVAHLAMALATGAGLALLILAVSAVLDWASLGNKEVDRLSEALFGPLTQSTLGILTLGLAAGISEEALFRGALQPRFGLGLTAVTFMLVHSQYGLSPASLMIFVVALVLGVMRQRTDTTTCMVTHATYNISVALLSLL